MPRTFFHRTCAVESAKNLTSLFSKRIVPSISSASIIGGDVTSWTSCWSNLNDIVKQLKNEGIKLPKQRGSKGKSDGAVSSDKTKLTDAGRIVVLFSWVSVSSMATCSSKCCRRRVCVVTYYWINFLFLIDILVPYTRFPRLYSTDRRCFFGTCLFQNCQQMKFPKNAMCELRVSKKRSSDFTWFLLGVLVSKKIK